MPTKLFFELTEEKRNTIIAAAIDEFAMCGYTNASTNSIVKQAKISKGSLFKYFKNKEELFFYILDTITTELNESIKLNADNLSFELFQRVIDYSTLEFLWYINNPQKAKLIIVAFTKSDTEIYQKTIVRYHMIESEIYYKFLEDIDLSNLRGDKRKTIDILKWFLKGFNDNFLEHMQNEKYSFEYLHEEYVRTLTEYMEIIKYGLIRKEEK